MNKAQIVSMVAALKKSEAEKTECGRRLIAFYTALSQ